MKLNTIIITLLCALLLWSIHINKQEINEINHANEIIKRQNKSIEQYDQILNSLVHMMKNTKLNKKRPAGIINKRQSRILIKLECTNNTSKNT